MNIISLVFERVPMAGVGVESHSRFSFLTHLLLSTLITSSLDTRLSSSLPLIIIVVSARARAALELGAAPLPLVVAPSCAWTDARRWARSPTTHGSLTSVHAGRQRHSVLPRNLLLIAKPE